MRYFPLFLDLKSKICLVVGAGPVGRRKINTLDRCSAGKIIVVDPGLKEDAFADSGNMVFKARTFVPEDVLGCDLVFACTSDSETNAGVVRACRERKIWCNAARDPEQGDFILPAVLDRGDLILAVSTCGASPALSAKIKKELMEKYGPEYALLARLMSGVRELVLPLGLAQEANREIFESILDSEIMQHLDNRNRQGVREELKRILPSDIHNNINGLIDALT